MNLVRRFLAAATLLVLSACSQPINVQVPTLEPQLGSNTGAASVNDMSANVEGVYLGGRWNSRPALVKFTRSGAVPWVKSLLVSAKVSEVAAGPDGAAYVVYIVDASGRTRTFFVRKYSQTGAVLWTQQLASGVGKGSDTAISASASGKGTLYLSVSSGCFVSAQAELRKYWAKGALA